MPINSLSVDYQKAAEAKKDNYGNPTIDHLNSNEIAKAGIWQSSQPNVICARPDSRQASTPPKPHLIQDPA